jgi:hypothetical protein
VGSAVWLNCTGLDDLDAGTHSEVVMRIRQVLEPLCKDAGETLTITKGDHHGDLNRDFDPDTDTRARELCPARDWAACSARHWPTSDCTSLAISSPMQNTPGSPMNVIFDGSPPFAPEERNINTQRKFWGTPWTTAANRLERDDRRRNRRRSESRDRTRR